MSEHQVFAAKHMQSKAATKQAGKMLASTAHSTHRFEDGVNDGSVHARVLAVKLLGHFRPIKQSKQGAHMCVFVSMCLRVCLFDIYLSRSTS